MPGITEVIIPGCENSVQFIFATTIDADCVEIEEERASFFIVQEAVLEPILPILSVGEYFEFQQELTLDQDSAVFLAQYLTESGELIEEHITLRVQSYCNFCPPALACPTEDWVVPTDNESCTADVAIPVPVLMGNLDTVAIHAEVYVVNNGQEIVIGGVDEAIFAVAQNPDMLGTVQGLSPGTYFYRYRVENPAGETFLEGCSFRVEDQVEPIARCKNDLELILLNTYDALDINDGSIDNCGPIAFEIRRSFRNSPENCEGSDEYFGPWGNFIQFSNCDLGQPITLELRVWDDRNQDGIPGNTIDIQQNDGTLISIADNFSVCSLEREVTANSNPVFLAHSEDQAEVFHLLPPVPNPFTENTMIRFYLPKEMEASLMVQNLTGQILFTKTAVFEAGYNEILLSREVLKATEGLFLLTLKSETQSQSQKLVLGH